MPPLQGNIYGNCSTKCSTPPERPFYTTEEPLYTAVKATYTALVINTPPWSELYRCMSYIPLLVCLLQQECGSVKRVICLVQHVIRLQTTGNMARTAVGAYIGYMSIQRVLWLQSLENRAQKEKPQATL